MVIESARNSSTMCIPYCRAMPQRNPYTTHTWFWKDISFVKEWVYFVWDSLYCMELYCIELDYIESYCIYCIVLHRIILYWIVLYWIVLYCTVLNRIVLNFTVRIGLDYMNIFVCDHVIFVCDHVILYMIMWFLCVSCDFDVWSCDFVQYHVFFNGIEWNITWNN